MNSQSQKSVKPGFFKRKYFIDKRFQGLFMAKFSGIAALCAIITIGGLWILKSQAYHLLPDNAPALVQVDAARGIALSKSENGTLSVSNNGEGIPYFPIRMTEGKGKQYNAFDLYLYPVIFVTLLNVLIILIFSLFFSHKMAGPVFKIKKLLNHYVATGEFDKIELRPGDHFQDLAAIINHAIKKKEK